MINLYGASQKPWKSSKLFSELMKNGITPTHVTFRNLISATSLWGQQEADRDALALMISHGIEPELVHYGAMVDGFARFGRSPGKEHYIKEAFRMVTDNEVPLDEIMVNAILSRCILERFVDQNDPVVAKRLKEKIKHAQDLVNYLDSIGFEYSVLETTFTRLKAMELNWPKNVRVA